VESFDPITPQGLSISNLFWFELIVSALLLALVIIWLVTALRRFRAAPGDDTNPPQVHGNPRLELIWTVTPAAVLAVVFVLVIATMRTVDADQPGAEPLRVIGHQWWWEFVYSTRQVPTANELHVPVGGSLQVTLESVDVIHSFHVPNFGWMQDMVPGKTNQMSMRIDRAGVFEGFCNQYCGLQHAWMKVRVVAEPPDQFAAWLQQQAQPAASSGSAGEQVFLRNTCVACHAIRGLPSTARVGPDLTHFGSRATLGAGVAQNSPDVLRNWIRNAQSIKPGVLMPAFANLSDADLAALADYLEGLK
jgi:cytochrome c oxidase subunit II